MRSSFSSNYSQNVYSPSSPLRSSLSTSRYDAMGSGMGTSRDLYRASPPRDVGSRDLGSRDLVRGAPARGSLPNRLSSRQASNEQHRSLDRARNDETNSLLQFYGVRKTSVGDSATQAILNRRKQEGNQQDRRKSLETNQMLSTREYGGAGPSTSQDRFGSKPPDTQDLSQNDYMARLMAAHNRVDDLLKSRGLSSEDENKYLRAWEQIPIIREELPIREERFSRRVRSPSNSSDSGLSTDNDSDRSASETATQVDNVLERIPHSESACHVIAEPVSSSLAHSCVATARCAESSTSLKRPGLDESASHTLLKSQPKFSSAQLKCVAAEKIEDEKPPAKAKRKLSPSKAAQKVAADTSAAGVVLQKTELPVQNKNIPVCLAAKPRAEKVLQKITVDQLQTVSERVKLPLVKQIPVQLKRQPSMEKVQSDMKMQQIERHSRTVREPETRRIEKNFRFTRSMDDVRKHVPTRQQQQRILQSLSRRRKKEVAPPCTAEISIQHCSFYQVSKHAEQIPSEKNVRINLRLTERALKNCAAHVALPAPPKMQFARLDIVLPSKKRRTKSNQVVARPLRKVGKLDRSNTMSIGEPAREQRKVNRIVIPEFFLQAHAEAMEDLRGARKHLKRVADQIVGGFVIAPKPQPKKDATTGLRRTGAVRRKPAPSKEPLGHIPKEPYEDFLPSSPKLPAEDFIQDRLAHPPDRHRRCATPFVSRPLNSKGSLDRTATTSGAACGCSFCRALFAELSDPDRRLVEQFRRSFHVPKPSTMRRMLHPFSLIRFLISPPVNRPEATFVRRRTPTRREPSQVRSPSPLRLRKVLSKPPKVVTTRFLDLPIQLKAVDRSKVRRKPKRPRKRWIPTWRRLCSEEEVEEVDEEEVEEVEVEEDVTDPEEITRKPKHRSITEDVDESLTEGEKAMAAAKRRHEDESEAKLIDYEERRRIEREKEEEDLRKLKEKQEKRRLEREQEEKEFAEKRRQEEEKRKIEEEERRSKIEEERRRKEDEKSRRQQLSGAAFTGVTGQGGRNFTIPKKTDHMGDKFGNIVQAKQEMSMTKDQQQQAKMAFLAQIEKGIPQATDLLPNDLRTKIKELHQRICRLETEKYDLEKRQERQEYDLKELNERQRQVARNNALKKGIDPAEAGNTRYPAKVQLISKYDRQIDRRNFSERRRMFDNRNGHPCFPGLPPPPALYEKVVKEYETDSVQGEGIEVEELEKNPGPPPLARGGGRPPIGWGTKYNEELEALKHLERCKYQEKVTMPIHAN